MLAAGVHVLTDLHADDLGLGHLLVEELDDPPQLAADDVGNEHQPQAAQPEVGADLRPKRLDVGVVAEYVSEL